MSAPCSLHLQAVGGCLLPSLGNYSVCHGKFGPCLQSLQAWSKLAAACSACSLQLRWLRLQYCHPSWQQQPYYSGAAASGVFDV